MDILPNWVDLVIVIILLRAGYVGFEFGTAYALLQLLGAVSATALCINFSPVLWDNIDSSLPFHGAQGFFWFFWLFFGGIAIAITFFLRRIAPLMKWERLNIWLQTFGTAIGVLRGMWWSFVLLLGLSASGIAYLQGSAKEQSVLGQRLLPVAETVVSEAIGSFPGALPERKALMPAFLGKSAKKSTTHSKRGKSVHGQDS